MPAPRLRIRLDADLKRATVAENAALKAIANDRGPASQRRPPGPMPRVESVADVTRGVGLSTALEGALQARIVDWLQIGDRRKVRGRMIADLNGTVHDHAQRQEIATRFWALWSDGERLSKSQLSLFGWDAATPTKKAKKPAARPNRPPGGGWETIPRGRRGGFRRRTARGLEYWYPDTGATSALHPHDTEAIDHERKKPDPRHDLDDPRVLDAATGGPVEGRRGNEKGGETPRGARGADPGQAPPVKASAPDRSDVDLDSPPPTGATFDNPADPGPTPTITAKSPAIALHPQYLPPIPDDVRLPESVKRFPRPTDKISEMFAHQIEGAERIRRAWIYGDGVLLQDSAGLGKTVTALAAIVAHGGARNLVVVPASGKEGLKAQWAGKDCAGLYGIEMRGVEVHTARTGKQSIRLNRDDLSATEPGTYLVSYDELTIPKLDERGEPVRDEKGRPVKIRDPRLFDGRWDTVTFDEAHSMANYDSKTGANSKELTDRADKALYLSATPFTNVTDINYLKKLGLWDEFHGKTFREADLTPPKGREGDRIRTDEEAFAAWANQAQAIVKTPSYSGIKNPSSQVPLTAIGAVLHATGVSISRTASLEGVESRFNVHGSLTAEQHAAFSLAREIAEEAGVYGINPMHVESLYKGWARQYWEICKVGEAIEHGKKALAEGKQVAFFTSYKTAEHAHLKAFPNMLRRRADGILRSNKSGAEAMAAQLDAYAAALDAKISELPPASSAVGDLVAAFGGPDVVAEIHGDTKKKPHVEQGLYQSGERKVVVATMARGGTGISLHDTVGDAPRVQICLSLPWTSREMTQVAGRSHRLGSKSNTRIHWLVGDDESERHNAAVVARRLRSAGSLTVGDPDANVSAGQLAAFDFGIESHEDPEKTIAEISESQSAIDELGDNDNEAPAKRAIEDDDARRARQHFHEIAEMMAAIQEGRNVLQERYAVAKEKRAIKAFNDSRREAHAIRQVRGFEGVRWRAGLGVYEIPASPSLSSRTMSSKAVGGEAKTYGRRQVMVYHVRPEGMAALRRDLAPTVDPKKVNLNDAPRESIDPDSRSAFDVLADELHQKSLLVRPHQNPELAGWALISGDTSRHQATGVWRSVGAIGERDRYGTFVGYRLPSAELPALHAALGGRVTPEQAAEAEASRGARPDPAPDLGESPARRFDIVVRGSRHYVTGRGTFDVKEKFKRMGLRFDWDHKEWWTSSAEVAERASLLKKSSAAPVLVLRDDCIGRELVAIFCDGDDDDLVKGAGHKYLTRLPSKNPPPKWRYIYRVPVRRGLVSDDKLRAGTKVKVEHAGRDGHFEVVRHDQKKGIVHLRHDESGKNAYVKHSDLKAMVESYHKKRGTAAVKKERAKKASEDSKKRVAPKKAKTPSPEKPAKEKPAEKPKALAVVEMGAISDWDAIVGFSPDAEGASAQAAALAKDGHEYASVRQPAGFAVVERRVSEKPKDGVILGGETAVFMRDSGGRGVASLPARFALMEAVKVVASHRPEKGFSAHSSYPADVQERRYEDLPGEQLKVGEISRKMEPAIVANTNPDAVNGAPVVTEDDVVLGGNGRAMGMQLAYAQEPEQAEKLKSYLRAHAREFGLSPSDVDAMKNPILVRRVEAGKDTAKLRALGRRMNEALTQGLDPRTAEVALGKNYVNKELVGVLVDQMDPDESLSDYLHNSKSAVFVNALHRAGILDERNRDEFVDKRGLLNEDGRMRVERVLAARLLPDAKILSAMPQDMRQNIAKSTPFLLRAEAAGWDIRKSLMAAVKADLDFRANYKGSKKKYLDQWTIKGSGHPTDALRKDPVAALLFHVARDFNGPTKMSAGFRSFARRAETAKESDTGTMSMFATAAETPIEALDRSFGISLEAKAQIAEDARKQRAEEDMLMRRAGLDPAKERKKAAAAKRKKAAENEGGESLSLSLVDDLIKGKGGKVRDDALARYMINAMLREIDAMVSSCANTAAISGKPLHVDPLAIKRRLNHWLSYEIAHDREMARASGAQPVSAEVIDGLIASVIKMHAGSVGGEKQ